MGDMSFGDLVGMDYATPDVSTPSYAPLPSLEANIPGTDPTLAGISSGGGGGGSSFGDIAKGVKDTIYTPPTEKGGEGGGILGTAASIAKPLLPFAGLATAGMNIAGGIQGARTAADQASIQKRAQRLQEQTAGQTAAAAAPLTQFGSQQLQQAAGGQIPPAIQAKIDEWKQGALAQAKDYMARSGQGNSQAMTQWEQYIEQQAKAMEAAYLQQEQQLGIQGLTQGAQALGSAGRQDQALIQGAAQQQTGIDTLMKQTNDVLARLTASAA
jgi:hypothetical protein